MRVIALLIACFMAPAGVHAAEESIFVLGFSDMSCGAWAKTAKHPVMRAQYVAWVRGFISGTNYAMARDQATTKASAETISLYLDQYCGRTPLGNILDGSAELRTDLKNRSAP